VRDVEARASGDEEFTTGAGPAFKECDVGVRERLGRGHETCGTSADDGEARARGHR
jgi:hypothetical protein